MRSAQNREGDLAGVRRLPPALRRHLDGADGSVQTTATARAAGKVTFAPAFLDTFTSSVMRMAGVAVSAQVPAGVPRYQSVARQTFAVTGLFEGDWVGLSTGAFERLPAERHTGRREVRGDGHASQSAGLSTGHLKPGSGVAATGTQLADHGPLTTDHDLGPLDASTAVPLPDLTPTGMSATAQSITSCGSATFTQLNVPVGTVLHPPLTATLTDLTPPVTGGPAAGEVGVDGIHGHRIEKTARLKLEIKDATGQEPTYPVLVQLAMGGPRHGQVILDPDGNRVTCDTAAFIWHERDSQGTLIAANEEFEIGMGTLSSYVGVAPDPVTPGQVVPVWGTAELLNLAAQAKVKINDVWADPLLMSYNVHPEPGKPDHLACWKTSGVPCSDVFSFWTGSFLYQEWIGNAYHLEDAFGNTIFGDTATSATPPGSDVTAQLTDQMSGALGDFAYYTLSVAWPKGVSAPSGQLATTLSVAYPNDPDWGAGVVSKTITLDFTGGSSHALVQKQNYDARFGADESAWPLTVAPGAGEGAMPKTSVGDTPRLVILALSGSNIPATIPASPIYLMPPGQDEPSLDAQHVYRNFGGTWTWVEATQQDAALEVGGNGAFRLSLVDTNGDAVPGTAFRVHACPRDEHLTAEAPPGGCTLAPVDSEKDGQGNETGIVSSFTLNAAGGQRGYMGIELTRAPINPGTYFIQVESIGTTPYRVRWESGHTTFATLENDLVGMFAICTVLGGEILDENFQRVTSFTVNQPTRAYVRYFASSGQEGSTTVDLTTFEDPTTDFDHLKGIAVARIGRSDVFLSGPIEFDPVWQTNTLQNASRSAEMTGHAQANRGSQQLVSSPPGYAVTVPRRGTGPVKVTRANRFIAGATTNSGHSYSIPMGLEIPLSVGFCQVRREDGSTRPSYFVCSPLGSIADCPADSNLMDPYRVTFSPLMPSRIEEVGDRQLARREFETASSPQWFLRGIRVTKGKVTDGPGAPDALTVAAVVDSSTAVEFSATVEVTKPGRLGTTLLTPTQAITYAGKNIVLQDLITTLADQLGIPPQFLAAQAYRESSFYTFSFHYEPFAWDFRWLTGDSTHPTNGVLNQDTTPWERKLLTNRQVYVKTRAPNGAGSTEYLPCWTQDGPCTAADAPPDPYYRDGVLQLSPSDPSKTVWLIPGFTSGDRIQLGVTISRNGQQLTQVFPPGRPEAGRSDQYEVDADDGTVKFGGPQPDGMQLDATWYPVGVDMATNPAGFGELLTTYATIPDASTAVTLIRSQVPERFHCIDNVPPGATLLTMSIRDWVQYRLKNGCPTINPIAPEQGLQRYGRTFDSDSLWVLMQHDPSFDVQAQWFGAASYGLLQINPDDHRWKLQTLLADWPDELAAAAAQYDPVHESPFKLFDPTVSLTAGAIEDAYSGGVGKESDFDTKCASARGFHNKCSWEALWRWRFCAFNTGNPNNAGDCTYSNRIFGWTRDSDGNDLPPLADSFVPQ